MGRGDRVGREGRVGREVGAVKEAGEVLERKCGKQGRWREKRLTIRGARAVRAAES